MTLDELRAAIKADPENRAMTDAGWEPLYTAGPHARIVVVGQAPGRKAQEAGVPWRDASGAKLCGWLGVSDDELHDPDRFAIVPMDFYYPGKGAKGSGDLPPRPGFAEKWHPRLLADLPDVRFTILIGAYAQRFYLGARRGKTLTETVHGWRSYLPEYFPLVHPSPLNFRWQARNPWFVEELVPELRAAVSLALA
ncbi:uracil-DNA glycosylase family protein [Gryllotalpicola protaetiae]|uniref:Uracil-DNA glycosylase family protein n=1 Tax=Gryllotalpicola protaetiae TaxID=2419771 RepID=A0A387BRK0_9MICO|nr:uracil-DNA glycosylase family protein [Gryllotalpicola protaetiae]AYG03577.1 uracil-DNA glycosylase family protein [Gryllotalpicola protaetiae]